MNTALTGRRTIPEVEQILNGYFPVLDHGFIALKDYMGGDLAVEEAARMSYGAGTRQRSQTRGLLRYLLRKWHTTPFEMVELKFHVAMPIFVARQWVRQRTASLNEYSGRYSLMPMAFYTPEHWRLQSQTNNQGSSGNVLDLGTEMAIGQRLMEIREESALLYADLTQADVARELARIDLPLSTYTQWVWKIDLHNLFRFLTQRADPHAQEEIRVYAHIMAGMVKRLVPIAFEAWVDYHFAGEAMSRMEMDVLRNLLKVSGTGHVCARDGIVLNDEDLAERGLSAREVAEFKAKLAYKEIPDFDLDTSQMFSGSYFEERMNAMVPTIDRG